MNEQAINTAVGSGGFLTTLADKVTPTEAFILILIVVLGYGFYKSWDKVGKMFKDREDTAIKRNNENNDMKNSVKEVASDLAAHISKDHKDIERRLDRFEKAMEDNNKELRSINDNTIKATAKIEVLVGRIIPKQTVSDER